MTNNSVAERKGIKPKLNGFRDRLISWLRALLTDWLTDWQTDQLIDGPIDWPTDRSTALLTDWLTDRSTGPLTDWLIYLLTDRLSVPRAWDVLIFLLQIYEDRQYTFLRNMSSICLRNNPSLTNFYKYLWYLISTGSDFGTSVET
jgi:hypothetical protein